MNMWEAIALIVIVVSAAKVIKAGIFSASGAAQRTALPEQNAPLADEALRREVTELRERIKVLERIVTDGATNGRASHDLADEIEKLR